MINEPKTEHPPLQPEHGREQMKCSLCNTLTSYNKTICDPCKLAYDKGFAEGIFQLIHSMELYGIIPYMYKEAYLQRNKSRDTSLPPN